jgi:hypothetical protein
MQPAQAASDALISVAMPDIRQRVANLRHNRLGPTQWCVVVARLDAANIMGLDFVRRSSPGFVPVGSGLVRGSARSCRPRTSWRG